MGEGYSVRLRLADVEIDAKVIFEQTVRYLKEYVTEPSKEADFSVSMTMKAIEAERQKCLENDSPQFSDTYLETLALYRQIAETTPRFGTILMHGSVLSVDGGGYMFTAKSGTGKSTHTRLWREALGERVTMINDDKPLLKLTEEGIRVFGTPWDGKHRLSTNTSVPLKAIAYLTRDENNWIKKMSPMEMLPILMQQIYRPETAESLAATMNVVDELIKRVSFYKLGVNMDKEAAYVAYEGMKGERP